MLGASLDARLAVSDGAAIVRDVKGELSAARTQLRREGRRARAALKAEVSTLRRELAERQRRSVRQLLEASQVVLCTNTGAAGRRRSAACGGASLEPFVVHQAPPTARSPACRPSTPSTSSSSTRRRTRSEAPLPGRVRDVSWTCPTGGAGARGVLLGGVAARPARGPRRRLAQPPSRRRQTSTTRELSRACPAGDHQQLPPVVKSEEAGRRGFGVTLFERLLRGPHGAGLGVMLTTQYRMHAAVCAWASDELYGGRIVDARLARDDAR